MTNTPQHDTRGVLSMANKGPNTNGSQFFITYTRAAHLNKKYTIFGRYVWYIALVYMYRHSPLAESSRASTHSTSSSTCPPMSAMCHCTRSGSTPSPFTPIHSPSSACAVPTSL